MRNLLSYILLFLLATAACGAQSQCSHGKVIADSICWPVSAPVGANIKLTGQTASMASTALCTTAQCPAGLYAVRGYLIVTGTATLGTAQLSIAYSDDAGSTTQNLGTAVSLLAAGRLSFDQTIELSGTSGLTATVTLAGVTGTPTYNVYLTAVQLAPY